MFYANFVENFGTLQNNFEYNFRVGVAGCVWTDVDEKKRKTIESKQEAQMNKLGWRMIKLDETTYGDMPSNTRAFIFYQNILIALKDPKNRRFSSKKR